MHLDLHSLWLLILFISSIKLQSILFHVINMLELGPFVLTLLTFHLVRLTTKLLITLAHLVLLILLALSLTSLMLPVFFLHVIFLFWILLTHPIHSILLCNLLELITIFITIQLISNILVTHVYLLSMVLFIILVRMIFHHFLFLPGTVVIWKGIMLIVLVLWRMYRIVLSWLLVQTGTNYLLLLFIRLIILILRALVLHLQSHLIAINCVDNMTLCFILLVLSVRASTSNLTHILIIGLGIICIPYL